MNESIPKAMALFPKTAAKIILLFGIFAFLVVTGIDTVDDLTCLFNTSGTAGLVNQTGDDDGHLPKIKGPESVYALSGEADLFISLIPALFNDRPISRFSPQFIVSSGTGRAPPTNS